MIQTELKYFTFNLTFGSKAYDHKMESKVQIAHLNNYNYSTWSWKIKHLLVEKGVWDIVTATPPTLSETPTPTETAAMTAWTPKDQKALAIIGLNVEDNQLLYIRSAATAKEAWDKLKEIHERDSVTNIVTLIRQMYATQMAEGSELRIHLDKLLDLFQKIEAIGETISETMRIGIILSSLTE